MLQAINKLAEAMQVIGLQHAPDRQQLLQQQSLAASQQQQQQQATQLTAAAAANGNHQQQQPIRWAIDIGACPGGWTSYLADSCGYHVLAVDPAPLHPDVTARPRVHQILGKAQEVGQQVDEVLAGQQVRSLAARGGGVSTPSCWRACMRCPGGGKRMLLCGRQGYVSTLNAVGMSRFFSNSSQQECLVWSFSCRQKCKPGAAGG